MFGKLVYDVHVCVLVHVRACASSFPLAASWGKPVQSFELITSSQAGTIIVTEWNYIMMSYHLCKCLLSKKYLQVSPFVVRNLWNIARALESTIPCVTGKIKAF